MRLKLSVAAEAKHKGMASAVGWATSELVFSAADDQQLLSWNLVTGPLSQPALRFDGRGN